jgi:hypothetical protein
MRKSFRSACAKAPLVLGLWIASHIVFAQQLAPPASPLCSDVLEAALPPTEATAALARCRNDAAVPKIKNARQSLSETLPADPADGRTCQARLDALTDGRNAPQDRIELEMYGTGRIQKLVLPGARSDDDDEVEFALQDYTHLFQDAAVSRLRPGTYSVEILPEDRQGLLVANERDFPSGASGALVLWRDDDPAAAPLVIHAGPGRADAFQRLATLLASPEEMDRLIGTLLSLRDPYAMVPFGVSDWESQQDPFGTNTCRLVQYAPYRLAIRVRTPGFLAGLHGKHFSRKVAKVSKSGASLIPAEVSWEQIDRAQLTTGMGPLGYLNVMRDLMRRIQDKSAEIRAIAYSNDAAEVRRVRLTQLNTDTADVVAEAATVLEGYRESARREGFVSDPQAWAAYVRELEDLVLGLEELGQNELGAVLKPGDAGGAVVLLWPASSNAPIATNACPLRVVERKLAPMKLPLALPQGDRELTAEGEGRFWFVRVPGTQDVFRLRSSIRYDMAQLASEHHEMAEWFIDNRLQPSCSDRFFLEKAAQAASQSGAVELQTGVRYERWQCGWFKYPCGVSLKGTKSCRKNIRTRLFQAGKSARHRLTPSVSGTALLLKLSGEGIAPIEGRFDLTDVPEFDALMVATGLTPESARFVEWNNRLWHGTELRGDVDLSAATACLIQSGLETH